MSGRLPEAQIAAQDGAPGRLAAPTGAERLAQAPQPGSAQASLSVERVGRAGVILGLLILAGIALRLWMISVSPLDPRFSNADDGDYYRRALRLAVTGQYVDDAWLIRPPLHVFFFASWLRLALIAGQPQLGVLVVQVAQTAVAALTTLSGFHVARRLFASERAGLLFAAFIALWYPFVEQPAVLFSELLYLALFLGHLWLLLRFDQSGRRRDLFFSGVALGAAALTRSPALYALAFVALWLALRWWARSCGTAEQRTKNKEQGNKGIREQGSNFSVHRRAPISHSSSSGEPPAASHQPSSGEPQATGHKLPALLAQILLVSAGCLAVVLPWTARNYVVYQRVIPVDTLGQINLWLDLDRVEDRNRNIETLRGLPQADRAGYALARAREILAEDPLRPLRPMWSTFQHIWKAQFVEDFFLKQSFFTRPLRETAALGLLGDPIWLVMTLAGLAGLAGPLREGLHNRLFFLAWLGYSFATVLVFHVEPRYLLPIWMLIGLYGAGWLAGLLRPRRQPGAARGIAGRIALIAQVAVVAGFLALVASYRDYPRIISAGLARERGYVAAERAYRAGDYPAAERGFREALAAQPGFVDAQVGLALALGAQGRQGEAMAALQRGSSRRAELAYGALAREAGQLEEARSILARYETIAGEDVQRWALEWLRPPARAQVSIGDGLDLGYIEGFLEAEQGPSGGYRWLSGRGQVVLDLPEPLEPGATLLLRVAGGRPGLTPLTVQVGDGPAQVVPVQAGQWRIYRVQIPDGLAGSRRLTVRLAAPTFVPALERPGSDDARALSVMLGEVRVQ